MTPFASFASKLALASSALALPSVAVANSNDDPASNDAPIQPVSIARGADLASKSTADQATRPAAASNAQQRPAGPPSGRQGQAGGPPPQMPKIDFDKTWHSVGVGAGALPSYTGTDD